MSGRKNRRKPIFTTSIEEYTAEREGRPRKQPVDPNLPRTPGWEIVAHRKATDEEIAQHAKEEMERVAKEIGEAADKLKKRPKKDWEPSPYRDPDIQGYLWPAACYISGEPANADQCNRQDQRDKEDKERLKRIQALNRLSEWKQFRDSENLEWDLEIAGWLEDIYWLGRYNERNRGSMYRAWEDGILRADKEYIKSQYQALHNVQHEDHVRVSIPPETDAQRYNRYRAWVERYNRQHGTNHPVHLEFQWRDEPAWEMEYNTLTEQQTGINIGTHISAAMAKRPHMDVSSTEDTEEHGGATAAAITHAHRLFGVHYYKCDFTITRKQHITLAQYKPGESGTSQYYVTCLPIQLFDFWVEKDDGTRWRDPFNSISQSWDYIAYNDAHIRLSHFIPLQNSLQGTAQQDQPAFNTAPYAYIAQDNLGMINKITAADAITHQTMVKQQIKLPSNTWWTNEDDEGLLGLDEVKTLHQNEHLYLNFKFDNQGNRFKRVRPIYDQANLYHLPQTICGDTGDVISGHTYNYGVSNVTQHTVTNVDLPFTFLFLPYIEKVSQAENATRLYAHILMETKINVTLWSIPDGSEQLGIVKNKGTLQTYKQPITNTILRAQAFQF